MLSKVWSRTTTITMMGATYSRGSRFGLLDPSRRTALSTLHAAAKHSPNSVSASRPIDLIGGAVAEQPLCPYQHTLLHRETGRESRQLYAVVTLVEPTQVCTSGEKVTIRRGNYRLREKHLKEREVAGLLVAPFRDGVLPNVIDGTCLICMNPVANRRCGDVVDGAKTQCGVQR